MTAAGLTCREFLDFLMDYLDGALPADSQGRFASHVEDCADCAAYLSSYRSTLTLLESVAKDAEAGVPADVPEPLVAAVLEARRKPR